MLYCCCQKARLPTFSPSGTKNFTQRAEKPGRTHLCGIAALVLLASGCDPVVNIYGSFFPAWVVCLVTGVMLTGLLRLMFAVTRLEWYLGPLVLVYPSLVLLLTLVTWLVFFQS